MSAEDVHNRSLPYTTRHASTYSSMSASVLISAVCLFASPDFGNSLLWSCPCRLGFHLINWQICPALGALRNTIRPGLDTKPRAECLRMPNWCVSVGKEMKGQTSPASSCSSSSSSLNMLETAGVGLMSRGRYWRRLRGSAQVSQTPWKHCWILGKLCLEGIDVVTVHLVSLSPLV